MNVLSPEISERRFVAVSFLTVLALTIVVPPLPYFVPLLTKLLVSMNVPSIPPTLFLVSSPIVERVFLLK